MFTKLILAILVFASAASLSEPLPKQPDAPDHPGSSNYPYPCFTKISQRFGDRSGTLYLPSGAPLNGPLVTIAFGHGHGIPEFSYARTFEHLARKGIAVLFVPYDTGRKDRDFERMARDYSLFVAETVAKYPGVLDAGKVVFSGHSNGATVAAMAAGLPPAESKITPAELLLFAIAGNHPEYYHQIPPRTPCTLVTGEDDTEDPIEFSKTVLKELPCERQLISLKGYHAPFRPQALATHSSICTFGWFGNQTSALHYHGYWKYLVGAAEDVAHGAKGTNPWLFGEAALDTGNPTIRHQLIRQ